MRRLWLLLVGLLLWEPVGASELLALRHSSSPERTRVVLELQGAAEGYRAARLRAPERLYIDLKGLRLSPRLERSIRVGRGLRAIRLGQFDPETVRVVLDLAAPLASYKVFRLGAPERLVVDLYWEPRPRRWRVVLDAGHGGKDPGAISPWGLREKDLTLALALLVRKALQGEPNLEVFLTRDRDVYLSLEERTMMANRLGADLFVSIHINSSPNPQARGLETYFLNWTDDAEAMRVAARENAISLKRMRQQRSEVAAILASLSLQGKRDDSLRLANYIQRGMVSRVGARYKVQNLGVKYALFYVLVGAQMPSALVEVSFLSNRQDERLLRDRRYLQEVAEGIARGIKAYLGDVPLRYLAQR